MIDAAGFIYVLGGQSGTDPNHITYRDVWVSQAMSLRATTNDSGLAAPNCLPDYEMSFFKNIPCCNPLSTFDNTHLECIPPHGQPPNTHEPSPPCPDGTNAAGSLGRR